MNRILALLSLCLILFSCNEKPNVDYYTEKEKVIPKEAFWIGDSENGNWIKVENINSHKNRAKISIYKKNGDLIDSKNFMLICSTDNQVFRKDLENEIVKFDGVKIYLKSGCWLQ